MTKGSSNGEEMPKTSRKRQRPAPAMTEKGRENVCIALSMNLAEKKLRDGTASNQLILHFLDLATEEAKLKRERLEADTALAKAKKGAYEAAALSDEKYEKAVEMMMRYTRRSDDQDI